MPWIETVAHPDATGLLKRIYDGAVQRAGRIFNIIAIQSRQPNVLNASTKLYVSMMHGPDEPLTRAQREMLAVTVSRTNACAY